MTTLEQLIGRTVVDAGIRFVKGTDTVQDGWIQLDDGRKLYLVDEEVESITQ